MKTIFLLGLFLISGFAATAQDNSQEEDFDKVLFKRYMARETRMLGRLLRKIVQNKDNPAYVEKRKDELARYFYDKNGSFRHKFDDKPFGDTYQFLDFVDKLIKYPRISLYWITDAPSIEYGYKASISGGGWVYHKNKTRVLERFISTNLVDKKNRIYGPYEFGLQIDFIIYNHKEMPHPFIKIRRIINAPDDWQLDTKSDTDDDGEKDIKDCCPFLKGTKESDYCPPDQPCLDNLNSFSYGLRPLIPSLGDYHCKEGAGGHWLWAGGVIGSAGLGIYYHFKSKKLYPGKLDIFEKGNFEDYKNAKLARQNSYVFYSLSALIWATDIIQSYHWCKRKKNEKTYSFNEKIKWEFGNQNPIFLAGDGYYYQNNFNIIGLSMTIDF